MILIKMKTTVRGGATCISYLSDKIHFKTNTVKLVDLSQLTAALAFIKI